MAGLLDPHIGRGLLNTFDTNNQFFRYPLAHTFASEHFLLMELRRLPDIGSDHFPLLVVLDYAANTSETNENPQQDAGDQEEADKAIDQEKSIDWQRIIEA